ncbi:hypothetical protein MIND_00584800 [Mycena indigotica]|uniref:Uncharacterized protein n=1 Tax=Mycena indigotica TaxID=2126181 RepID=A0A8H6SR74_9AGAR|nr:uncharacterized protein MIND_00584800 [Mycena indigotica]KAF7303555.1 hypothetical protein MIND_00584800 [Mycena indigotica]
MFNKSLLLFCAMAASGALAAPLLPRQAAGCNAAQTQALVADVAAQAAVIRSIGFVLPDPMRRTPAQAATFETLLAATKAASAAAARSDFAGAGAQLAAVQRTADGLLDGLLGDGLESSEDLALLDKTDKARRAVAACAGGAAAQDVEADDVEAEEEEAEGDDIIAVTDGSELEARQEEVVEDAETEDVEATEAEDETETETETETAGDALADAQAAAEAAATAAGAAAGDVLASAKAAADAAAKAVAGACDVAGLSGALSGVSQAAAVIRGIGFILPDPVRRSDANRAKFEQLVAAAAAARAAAAGNNLGGAKAKLAEVDGLMNAVIGDLVGDGQASSEDLELLKQIDAAKKKAATC